MRRIKWDNYSEDLGAELLVLGSDPLAEAVEFDLVPVDGHGLQVLLGQRQPQLNSTVTKKKNLLDEI